MTISQIDNKIEKLSEKLVELRNNAKPNEEKEIRILKKIKKLSDRKKEMLQMMEHSSTTDTNITA